MASAEERAQARREAAHRRRREEEDARAAERHAEALSDTRAGLGETPPKTAQTAPVKPHGRRKKRPTRRTLSVKGATYARLKAYCEANGLACSGVCEMLLNDYLDAQGHPKWEGQLPHVEERRRMEQAARDAASGVFTF